MTPNGTPAGDPLVYAVMACYFALLLGVGWAFKRFIRNTSDYFRMGSQGTWWMVGVSVFISNMSAWTFSGGAGQAFEWGWTIFYNYWPVGIGFLLCALVFAPWFRQLRATTGPEAIGMRFNELTRQIFGWKNLIGMPLLGAVQLYGLAIFASAVCGFRVELVIITLGVVVSIYATLGGRFAITATDFLQALIIIPTATLVAVLCLAQFGGIGGFLSAIKAAGLTEKYSLFKDAAVRPANGTYGPLWITAAILYFMLLNNVNVAVSAKFFIVKDSASARRSAWLACALVLVGSLLWFIPPITAKLLYTADVAKIAVGNPAEASYAVAALKLLPSGLVGVMLVAIFASTMGAMDTALNQNTAVAVRDVYPVLCRGFGWRMASEDGQLRASRYLTLFFGALVAGIALVYSQLKGLTLFDLIMNVLALTGLPFQVPLFWGLFVRKVPRWSALFSGLITVGPALVFFFDKLVLGFSVPWHHRILIQFGVGTLAFFSTRLFWSRVSAADRDHVDEFFQRMHTPIDFAKEVGSGSDKAQFRLVGLFTLIVGCGVGLLALVKGSITDRATIAVLGVAYLTLGTVFLLLSRERKAPAAATRRAPVPERVN